MNPRSMTPLPMFTLDDVRVASPCPADWDAMTGTDQARFCDQCHKNVYNLSALTRAEAEALVLEKEGHLCVRYYARADGTVLTRDCPVGLRAVRARVARKLSYAAALLLAGLTGLMRGNVAEAVNVTKQQAAAQSHAAPPPNWLQAIAGRLNPPRMGAPASPVLMGSPPSRPLIVGKLAAPRPVPKPRLIPMLGGMVAPLPHPPAPPIPPKHGKGRR